MTVSWLQELIDRNKTTERKPFQLPNFKVERNRFDPSSYYRDLDTIGDISRAASRQEEIRAANRAREEAEKVRQQSLIAQPSEAPVADTGSKLGLPLGNFRVTSGYGRRTHPVHGGQSHHTGIDLAAPEGTPIYATHSGVVSTSGMQGGYGNLVILNGANGLQTYYAHNSRNAVKVGQTVQQGQIIGYVGSTGVSTGPHLHYEVRINGRHVNPAGYM